MTPSHFPPPEWYQKDRLQGYSIEDMSEYALEENDPTAPEGALNCLSMRLSSPEGKAYTLQFYNYRIEIKDFEYVSGVSFRWVNDTVYSHARGRFFLEVTLSVNDSHTKALAFSFEDSRLTPTP